MSIQAETVSGIEQRLDTIIQLLAGPIVQGKNVKDSVRALAEVGIDASLIAAICHTERKTVAARLSEIKREPAANRKGGNKEGTVRQ